MTECSISSDCIIISCRWVIDKHDWIVRSEYSTVDSSSTAVAVVDSEVVSSGVRILKLETGVDCCLEADEEENKRRRDDEDDVDVKVSDEFADTSDSSESEKIGVLVEASDFNAPRSE